MQGDKMQLQLNLELDREQINHFFWIAYGASLMHFQNAEGASEAYDQIVKQIEDFFVSHNPDSKQTLDNVKQMIANGRKPKAQA
jgi:hypothetical protein